MSTVKESQKRKKVMSFHLMVVTIFNIWSFISVKLLHITTSKIFLSSRQLILLMLGLLSLSLSNFLMMQEMFKLYSPYFNWSIFLWRKTIQDKLSDKKELKRISWWFWTFLMMFFHFVQANPKLFVIKRKYINSPLLHLCLLQYLIVIW